MFDAGEFDVEFEMELGAESLQEIHDNKIRDKPNASTKDSVSAGQNPQ